MKQFRPVTFVAFALLVAAFAAIRLWHLTASCLAFDEIFSIHAAEHAWNSLFSFVALDLIHPPLFYVLLKLWIGVGGESLFWLRLFPVVFSVVAIFPFILLCREIKLDSWTRNLALFFIASNGSLIKYAQEVRMYSLLMCFSVFSLWLFSMYLVKGKGFLPLVLINLLLIYTHYFGWFVIAGETAAIVILQRGKWRAALMMLAIEFTCFMPWIYSVWNAGNSGSELGQNIGWMARPGARQVFTFILNLAEPFYYQATNIEPVSMFRVSLPIILIAVVGICLYVAKWKQQSEGDRQTVKRLLLFIAAPVITAFAMSWSLPYSVWGTRHLIIVFIPFSIVLAICLCKIPNAAIRTAAVTLILLFSGYGLALESMRTGTPYSWCGWEPLAGEASSKNNANIYTFEDLVAYYIWFGGRDRQIRSNVLKVADIDGIAEDKAYFLPRGFKDVARVNFDQISDASLWIAYRSKTVDPNEPPLRNFIVKGYRIIDRQVIEANGEAAILILLEK